MSLLPPGVGFPDVSCSYCSAPAQQPYSPTFPKALLDSEELAWWLKQAPLTEFLVK